MKLRSLLSQIVSEMRLKYPEASSEEITDAIIETVQDDILPNAVKIMKLPAPPSQIRILLETKRQERHRKKYRYANIQQKMSLSQNLEYLKYHLNNGKEDNLSSSTAGLFFGDLDSAVINNVNSLNSPIGKSYIEKNDGLPVSIEIGFSRFSKPFEKDKSNPYIKSEVVTSRSTQVLMDDDIQNRFFANSLYLQIISSIEIFLRDIATKYNDASFAISINIDPEIVTWEKVIIRIAIPSLDIEQKMDTWDEIDIELRKVLRNLSGLNAKKNTEIDTISKKIFTHMDL